MVILFCHRWSFKKIMNYDCPVQKDEQRHLLLLTIVVQKVVSRCLYIPGKAVELCALTASSAQLSRMLSLLIGLLQWSCQRSTENRACKFRAIGPSSCFFEAGPDSVSFFFIQERKKGWQEFHPDFEFFIVATFQPRCSS